MSSMDTYETVVGLEVHTQLLTRTKLFCSDSTNFGVDPNTQVSVISLAHPGTLPRLNREVIPMAVRLGLALNCDISRKNYFARKNYFYPDLPKGYQVSQHTTPICRNGSLELDINNKKIGVRINRIHMEEDAGKTIHEPNGPWSAIDYNRAGMPLLEIVTEPDIRSADEAFAFVTALRKIVRKLGICDGNMEEGSFRVDVNISIRKKGEEKLGMRAEIKNLNSIRFIKKAILFEQERMARLLEEGKTVVQETRGFREEDGSTYSIRIKEDEDDYRYFPEPDLPEFHISEELIEEQRALLPPPAEKLVEMIISKYGLPLQDARQLADDEELYNFFIDVSSLSNNNKASANFVLVTLRNHLSSSETGLIESRISPASIARLVDLVDEGKINHGIASQKIFPKLAEDPALDIDDFIEKEGLQMEGATAEIEKLIDAALLKHAEKITEYRKGKKGLLSLFVGEVMKLSKGRADAKMITEKILEKLKSN
jgi:aspartyl-tRNA(Asn)/glutamyl-tRNA(Gln) amidotransferase subunit B